MKKECKDELTANNIPNKKSPKIKKYTAMIILPIRRFMSLQLFIKI